MDKIKKFSEFSPISENVKYHIENGINFTKNIFRPGSDAFYSLLGEVRELYDNNLIELSGLDKELYEKTDLGMFSHYDGNLVPLDIPMYDDQTPVSESSAEYRGKSVKLNQPSRSSGPKKYKVYVKNPDTGNVIKVNFGDVKGGLTSKITDPAARKRYDARHGCSAGRHEDKTKAGYWSCRLPRYAKNLGLAETSAKWW
jgi:hypothetical protein